jgi:hypothetical protein
MGASRYAKKHQDQTLPSNHGEPRVLPLRFAPSQNFFRKDAKAASGDAGVKDSIIDHGLGSIQPIISQPRAQDSKTRPHPFAVQPFSSYNG